MDCFHDLPFWPVSLTVLRRLCADAVEVSSVPPIEVIEEARLGWNLLLGHSWFVRGEPTRWEVGVSVEDCELSCGSDIFVQRFEGDRKLDEASGVWFGETTGRSWRLKESQGRQQYYTGISVSTGSKCHYLVAVLLPLSHTVNDPSFNPTPCLTRIIGQVSQADLILG